MEILGLKYANLMREEALELCAALLDRPEKSTVLFLNLDCLAKAERDAEYARIVRAAELVLPDGIGLRCATALCGGRMRDNCNGTDLSPRLMERCARRGSPVYFLGGREGVAERAARKLRENFPNLKIAGTRCGYDCGAETVEAINASGAEVLFVGMGVPVQEKWIFANRERLRPKLCLGVGALFDWFSGYHRRAPWLFRQMNLEWVWRMTIEPQRLCRRYLVDDLGFLSRMAARRWLRRPPLPAPASVPSVVPPRMLPLVFPSDAPQNAAASTLPSHEAIS